MSAGVDNIWFLVLLTVANTLLYHLPLATYTLANLDYSSVQGARTLLTLVVIILVVTTVLLCTVSIISTKLLKALAAIIAIANAAALYFISTYQILLDKTMMGNIFNTRSSESFEFLHPKLFIYVLFLGVVPAWFILKARVKKVRRIRTLLYMVTSLILGLLIIYLNASTALWFDKHAKKIGGMIIPSAYIINSARFQYDHSKKNAQLTLLPAATTNTEQKTIVVLVIGETARAANFSLYGYDRPTNPKISKSNAIVLPNAIACSTYTTASIHCMLSHDGTTSGSFESLPSYLQRNDVDVVWRTNNWGEPPLTIAEYVKGGDLRDACTSANCDHDEVLLTGLVERIESSTSDKMLVVLHTKGSHGPSYHTRYPKEFEVFKPTCKSVELDKCSQQELINAYDNTIVYTDHLLDQTINRLQELTELPTLMLYVSDHGESLGEDGMYLHGLPNALAPAVQLEIPFIIWMSEGFKKLNAIEVNQFTNAKYSHKNVFHSILGAFGIRSSVYDPALDIFNSVVR